MVSIGDCFDNAVVESFWARMQVELLNRRRWRTRVELANAIAAAGPLKRLTAVTGRRVAADHC